MKATYTRTLARKILLAFLAFIIIFSVAALVVRNSITKKLENISKLASDVEQNQYKPEKALLLLHHAEDDFQESLLDPGNQKSVDYKLNLAQAFNEIDNLLKEKTDTAHLTSVQRKQVKFWYTQKLKLSDKLYVLRHNFDSLLTMYADFSIQTNRNLTGTGNKRIYAGQIAQLQQQNIKLLSMQKELIALNSYINDELEHIISNVKEINYKMADEFKKMSFKSYQSTTTLLNKFYLAALFLVLVFAILLVLSIVELNRSELLLRKENERSVVIAQQKMDLLLHMSHEIRNPLTAIKGFLYIFSKTSLSQKQEEMLNSIRLSSDMLLQTLNDTLDAAKMENSEFKINKDPFNPNYTLKMVIESMEFSAAKKKLTIAYNFKGDPEAVVTGDGFRLKQIMVNLLSNAIKYTREGSVTVTAELLGKENRLQVDVTDTGVGISPEQQSNLFAKYYQTNSSKGQTGTGLGLYICKQLVVLQGGKITVKSNPDTGTTFSFFIPYQKGEYTIAPRQDDPLSLLNGINILAVDDNALSLMFLKMMTDKWNVKFLQAANGKEALEIIAENPVTVVLTDMEMPEMNGGELLAAIKELNSPLNQLPVIVITGNARPADTEKFLKMGFSGSIGKPFTEAELTKQLVKVLRPKT